MVMAFGLLVEFLLQLAQGYGTRVVIFLLIY